MLQNHAYSSNLGCDNFCGIGRIFGDAGLRAFEKDYDYAETSAAAASFALIPVCSSHTAGSAGTYSRRVSHAEPMAAVCRFKFYFRRSGQS